MALMVVETERIMRSQAIKAYGIYCSTRVVQSGKGTPLI